MKWSRTMLATALSTALLSVGLAGCERVQSADEKTAAGAAIAETAPEGETADQFVARLDKEMREIYLEQNYAQWAASTNINGDTEFLAAKANERGLLQLNRWIEQAKKYEGQDLKPETARALKLLKLMTSMPAPKDPAKVSELTKIVAKLEGAYGAGKYCKDGDTTNCRELGDLEDVLRSNRNYDEQLDAMNGWYATSVPSKKDYTRFVELVNEGAKEMGFADAGEMWRSGYDMPANEVGPEVDRLWAQLKPMYEQLHCYVGAKLDEKYGKDKGHTAGGMLPAHLTGNMWQQDWGNLWDIAAPYPNASPLDINGALKAIEDRNIADALVKAGGSAPDSQNDAFQAGKLTTAKQMFERAENFYTSLGQPKLPASFWEKTQFIKPRDRDVVCHASAWDLDMKGDVRIKMCTKANEEDFTTIYHELGHIYYDLNYNPQPAYFQNGANDGFHEAIGDTMVLAMTPKYLNSIGLVGAQTESQESLINSQMRMALAKVAFVPFGLMIDKWRWGVFDGSIKPGEYNSAWWKLKAEYQGVAPVAARGEEFFDAGAKYHVPANTPYLRYFMAHVLQFQFYKAMCDASGYTGPLNECSFYGNAAAGQKLKTMLSRGASQPWQQTLKEMTGSEKLDAAPMVEYFKPLNDWLKTQNAGRSCGWTAAGTGAPAAPAPAAAPAAPAATPAPQEPAKPANT